MILKELSLSLKSSRKKICFGWKDWFTVHELSGSLEMFVFSNLIFDRQVGNLLFIRFESVAWRSGLICCYCLKYMLATICQDLLWWLISFRNLGMEVEIKVGIWFGFFFLSMVRIYIMTACGNWHVWSLKLIGTLILIGWPLLWVGLMLYFDYCLWTWIVIEMLF